MRITKLIAERLDLRDDATDYGGKSHSNEKLDEFMEEVSLPYGTYLSTVNKSLVECGLEPFTKEQIFEAIKPCYFGAIPKTEEWLDDDTFIIYFEERVSVENWGDGKKPYMRQLYAEVHVDENNDVIIGENIYHVSDDGSEGDYIDTDYYDGVPLLEMSQKTGKLIKAYALLRLKENE